MKTKLFIETVTTVLVILFCFSCREGENRNKNKDDLLIANAYQYDTLILSAEYTECGEFGGHREVFKIYSNQEHEIWAGYSKDTVNCEGEMRRGVIFQKRIKLSQGDQKLVIKYMHDLLNQNFINKPIVSNALQSFSIATSDSSLAIYHYANSYDGFDRLRNGLVK